MKYFVILASLIVMLTIAIDKCQFACAHRGGEQHDSDESGDISCNSTSCQNGGNCTTQVKRNGDTETECVCAPEWRGQQCEKVNNCFISNVTCSGNGKCHNKNTGYECKCKKGFEGSNCQIVKPTRPQRVRH